MKVFLIILAFHFCYFLNNSLFNPKNENSKNEDTKNLTLDKKIDEYINNIGDIIHRFMFTKINTIVEENPDISDECLDLLKIIIDEPKIVVNNIAKKLVRDGFVANTIEAEERCLENNEIFFFNKFRLFNISYF